MSLRLLIVPEAISLAHVSRCLKIAIAARERGHAVRVAMAEPYRDLLVRAGFEVEELYSVSPEEALLAIRKGTTLYTNDVLRKYVRSDLDALEREPVDAVIGDLRLSLDISSELADVPYVSVLNAYWSPDYAARLPAPETFPLFRLLGRTLSSKLMPCLRPLILRRFAAVFNRYRRELGLERRHDVLDVMNSRDLTLLADLPEFAPCSTLPPATRYVGPFLWEPDVPAPEWLSDVARDKPTVYVTMGSTGETHMFVRVLHELAAAGLQVLTTTCGQIPPNDIPSGCFAADLAPAGRLLEFASATLCHGGNGSIYQSLSHGVPVVGIPTFHDQEFNMDRVDALGLGVRLSPLNLAARDIHDAVSQVIDDPAYAQRARGFAELISRWDAPTETVRSVEELLASAKSQREGRTMTRDVALDVSQSRA